MCLISLFNLFQFHNPLLARILPRMRNYTKYRKGMILYSIYNMNIQKNPKLLQFVSFA